ncbi:hypothetical protein OFN33_30720, partial [Escherichia coli]|nr:hypothetical protein [Escherichia coli]
MSRIDRDQDGTLLVTTMPLWQVYAGTGAALVRNARARDLADAVARQACGSSTEKLDGDQDVAYGQVRARYRCLQ